MLTLRQEGNLRRAPDALEHCDVMGQSGECAGLVRDADVILGGTEGDARVADRVSQRPGRCGVARRIARRREQGEGVAARRRAADTELGVRPDRSGGAVEPRHDVRDAGQTE